MSVDSPSGSYGDNGGGDPVDTTAPADSGQATTTAQQDSTATNTQTTSATGGGGGTATGGNAGPSQVTGDSSQRGSHGGNAFASGGHAEAHNSLDNQQSSQISGRDGSWSGYSGNGKFVLQTRKRRGSGGAAARTDHARSPGVSGFGAANRAAQLKVKEPRGHETAKASPLGGGLLGHGGQLPGQNPFFNLLSGSGGAGAGLTLLLLAVLGASIALPNNRFKAFRTPTVTWRPLAYVPPIELPG